MATVLFVHSFQLEAIDALEVTTCGENGLEGAILAAFQQLPEVPEQMQDCPAYDDYIWTLVVSHWSRSFNS